MSFTVQKNLCNSLFRFVRRRRGLKSIDNNTEMSTGSSGEFIRHRPEISYSADLRAIHVSDAADAVEHVVLGVADGRHEHLRERRVGVVGAAGQDDLLQSRPSRQPQRHAAGVRDAPSDRQIRGDGLDAA
ncbi:MAG TPA: hypothetical protein VEK57_03695 [Thermoanaerobaculia bacterium]|nr:hypothetical protein [Thermoanaerobaculia bacterium]